MKFWLSSSSSHDGAERTEKKSGDDMHTHQTRAKWSSARRICDVASVRHVVEFLCWDWRRKEFKSHKLNRRFSSERAWSFTIEEISPHTSSDTSFRYQSTAELLFSHSFARASMLRSFDSENDWLVERFYDFSSIGQSINSCDISYDRAELELRSDIRSPSW